MPAHECWCPPHMVPDVSLSVLFAFMAMYRLDVSLNIMSLGELTLGVGMLVDNAVVEAPR